MKISALSKFRFDDYVKGMGVTPLNVNTFKNKYFISISHSTVFDEISEAEMERIKALEVSINEHREKKNYHVSKQEYEPAAYARDEEKKLQAELDLLSPEWMPMFKNNSPNVLVLLFDDVIDENFNTMNAKPFTDEQADEVIGFLRRIAYDGNKDTELIVHCAMGSSRSVAIAEFAAEMFNEKYINARIDRNANKLVLRKLNEARARKQNQISI